MPPRKEIETPNYIEIYHINGVTDFAKATAYIYTYAAETEKEVRVREEDYGEFEIAVYCNEIRHMRICEYFESAKIYWHY